MAAVPLQSAFKAALASDSPLEKSAIFLAADACHWWQRPIGLDYILLRVGVFAERRRRQLQIRGCSSAGRAPDLHSGGRRFDPDQLHQFDLLNGMSLRAFQRGEDSNNGPVAQLVRAHP